MSLKEVIPQDIILKKLLYHVSVAKAQARTLQFILNNFYYVVNITVIPSTLQIALP